MANINLIYLRIWKLAKPYYLKGRAYDVKHIEWMMAEANNLAKAESLDKKLLLPSLFSMTWVIQNSKRLIPALRIRIRK